MQAKTHLENMTVPLMLSIIRLLLFVALALGAHAFRLTLILKDGQTRSITRADLQDTNTLLKCNKFEDFLNSNLFFSLNTVKEHGIDNNPRQIDTITWEPDADSEFNAKRVGLKRPREDDIPIYTLFVFGNEDCKPSVDSYFDKKFRDEWRHHAFPLMEQEKKTFRWDGLNLLPHGLYSFQLATRSIFVRPDRKVSVRHPELGQCVDIVYPDTFPRAEPYWQYGSLWNARARAREEDDISVCSVFRGCNIF